MVCHWGRGHRWSYVCIIKTGLQWYAFFFTEYWLKLVCQRHPNKTVRTWCSWNTPRNVAGHSGNSICSWRSIGRYNGQMWNIYDGQFKENGAGGYFRPKRFQMSVRFTRWSGSSRGIFWSSMGSLLSPLESHYILDGKPLFSFFFFTCL